MYSSLQAYDFFLPLSLGIFATRQRVTSTSSWSAGDSLLSMSSKVSVFFFLAGASSGAEVGSGNIAAAMTSFKRLSKSNLKLVYSSV